MKQHPNAVAGPLDHTTVSIDELRLYEGNARQGDIGAITQSLTRLGQYRPIVVNKGTRTGRPWEVLAGNHTTQAAKALGWQTLIATVVDVDDDTARRIVLADNRTNDLATTDEHALRELLLALEGDFSGTGYDGDDLDDVIRGLPTGDDFLPQDENAAGRIDKRPVTDCPKCGFTFEVTARRQVRE